MVNEKIEVVSPNVRYTEKYIEAEYKYESTVIEKENDVLKIHPRSTSIQFRTERYTPKLGVMLVGWGGNNGTTVTAAVLANSMAMSWNTKDGVVKANYFGSLTQVATVCMGTLSDTGEEVHVPFRNLLPMMDPNDLVIGGWDISSMNLADAMKRAKVLDYNLQSQLRSYMQKMVPLPAIYDNDFIAANQEDRADNVLKGTTWEKIEQVRKNIRDFKALNNLDKVIVLWTANTERYCDIRADLNGTADALMKSIHENASEISPSTLYAVASILERCTYINGAPQNTFVPGCIELAERYKVFIAGDDFKSGQTKFKSVLVDFLVGAGIKPVSIVSYNHLGNNDGRNLSAPQQFRSKEISKSNVVDDVVTSNPILYKRNEKPDHCVVIKYVPYVGDSKRAMDEYTSEIMMGGKNTIVVHNTCEDSLLASPIILDLIILAEICERISFKVLNKNAQHQEFQSMNAVLSLLSYLCKAPLVPHGAPVVNALFKQRACIENLFRACLGLSPQNHIALEHKLSNPEMWSTEEQSRILRHDIRQVNGFVTKPEKVSSIVKEALASSNIVKDGSHL